MARSVQEIYNDLLPRVKTALGIPATTVITTTSFEGMLVYAYAFVTNVLEVIFDKFKADVERLIALQKPHSLSWYAELVKSFQYGYTIDPETLEYDNSALTDEQIAASKIIQYVAVVEGNDVLRIKTAKQGATDLEVLEPAELEDLTSFLNRKKDAGVKLSIESRVADKLKVEIDVYVDPLKFNENGIEIAESKETLPDVIKNYLKNLPFNGILALDLMVDQLQARDGVVFTQLKTAEWTYGILPFTSINGFVLPDAGYLRFETEADLKINYKFQTPV